MFASVVVTWSGVDATSVADGGSRQIGCSIVYHAGNRFLKRPRALISSSDEENFTLKFTSTVTIRKQPSVIKGLLSLRAHARVFTVINLRMATSYKFGIVGNSHSSLGDQVVSSMRRLSCVPCFTADVGSAATTAAAAAGPATDTTIAQSDFCILVRTIDRGSKSSSPSW